jgi:hypothetical protein
MALNQHNRQRMKCRRKNQSAQRRRLKSRWLNGVMKSGINGEIGVSMLRLAKKMT